MVIGPPLDAAPPRRCYAELCGTLQRPRPRGHRFSHFCSPFEDGLGAAARLDGILGGVEERHEEVLSRTRTPDVRGVDEEELYSGAGGRAAAELPPTAAAPPRCK